MAQNVACWALNAQAGSPTYTAEMIRATSHMMLTPAPPGKPLGCFSGVRPGTPSNTVTVSGTKVTVKPHAGMIDAGSTSPGYSYAVLDSATLELSAPHATYSRNDIIYIAIDDPSRGDGSPAPKAEIRVATGTPAAYPKDPAISGSCILRLARIQTPAQGSAQGSVTWLAQSLYPATNDVQVRAMLAELGVPVPYASKSAIEASNPTKVGVLAKDLSSGIVWAWNGSRWRKWDTPDWAAASFERGQYISSISIQYKLTAGQCQILGNVNPSTGISGNWGFARITDPDLYETPNFVPLTIRGDKPVSGLLKPGTGQLSLNTTSDLWGAYFSAIFTVKMK